MSSSIGHRMSRSALRGLWEMATPLFGAEFVHEAMSVPDVLLLIEIARRVPDNDSWFPRGQWATIQRMQSWASNDLDELARRVAESARLLKGAKDTDENLAGFPHEIGVEADEADEASEALREAANETAG